MWSVSVHDTVTGERLMTFAGEEAVSDAAWSRSPGEGSGSHVFQTRSSGERLPANVWRQLCEPNATSTVVSWDGVPVYAGLNIDAGYAADSGALTVKHVNIRALFRERLTFGARSAPVGLPLDGNLAFANKSASGAVREILIYGLGEGGRGGPEWHLPVDLPVDGAGTFEMRVAWWEWSRIDDLLARLERVGVVIDFDPYFDASGKLRYLVRIGEPVLPGGKLEFLTHADGSPVKDLVWRRDGSRQLTGVFYMGKGTEEDMRFGEAGYLPGPTIPVRDAARSAKDVSDKKVLDQMALTDLRRNRGPADSFAFNLVADGSWAVHQLRPGTSVGLGVWGDEVIPDGMHQVVVTGVSGDLSYVLKPEVMTL